MTKTRKSLSETAVKRAASAKHSDAASEENTTTAIVLPKDLLTLLQDTAHKRRAKLGGRASVSAIIVEALRGIEQKLRAE